MRRIFFTVAINQRYQIYFGEINNELFGSLKDLSKIKIKVKIDVVIENGIEINKLENDYEIIQNCQIGENQKM